MQGVMENKKSTNKGLSIFERFAYGCGDFGCNIIYTAMSVFFIKILCRLCWRKCCSSWYNNVNI